MVREIASGHSYPMSAANTSTWTRNIVTSAWTIEQYEYMDEEHSDECMDDAINIHEQSECYMCKQYECNEYVRSALARSKYEYMDEEHSDEYMDDLYS
jgi:hypothetical protein